MKLTREVKDILAARLKREAGKIKPPPPSKALVAARKQLAKLEKEHKKLKARIHQMAGTSEYDSRRANVYVATLNEHIWADTKEQIKYIQRVSDRLDAAVLSGVDVDIEALFKK